MMRLSSALISIFIIANCVVLNAQDKPDYSVYLIGDAGAPKTDIPDPVLSKLQERLGNENKKSAIIFLGDNVYNNGLYPNKYVVEEGERAKAEKRLLAQLQAVEDFKGEIYFIPGNHDWNDARPDGIDFIEAQEEFIEFYLDRGDVLIPDHGCPGPEKKKLGKDIVLVAMDSQWWLHPHTDDQKEKASCKNKNIDEIIVEFKEILDEEEDKIIIVALHHPIFSDGSHNGYYSLGDHIFPLRALNTNLWIPLPGLGSLHPFYRSAFGAKQDMPHPLYQTLITKILDAIHTRKNIIFASGHEHNLQYFSEKNNHFIKSGSGSKRSGLPKITDAVFSDAAKGYAKLEYYKSGRVDLRFFTIEEEIEVEKFVQTIIEPQPEFGKKYDPYQIDLDTITRQASELYDKGGLHRLIFGNLYREDWSTPVSFRPFNISTEKGGLKPRKIGGGMSSKSIRLKAPDKKQYVLRSVEKGVAKVVPEMFRKSLVQDIFQDQIAASQPYAALIVPPIADAVGVYHTNPELVYLPQQEALGAFNEEYGDALYLFEERPSGNQEDKEEFGNSRKIISYLDMLDKIQSTSADHIHQDQVLRSRLLDIYLGDWDRHDDQWRWASFKELNEEGTETHTYYEPIPRDRDQVLYRYEGLMPFISKMLSFELRKFQTFGEDISNLKFLAYNARHFDRSYLNELEWDEWESIAAEFTSKLTDDVLEEAISRLPEPIRELRGADYLIAFKARRNKINEWAKEHYEFLSKYVDVVGTNKNELFLVNRNNDGTVDVKVYQVKKKGEIDDLIYERSFDPDITNEIRLYGLSGDDEFHISGESKKGPKIRIIGGKGNDELFDKSKLTGSKKSTYSYDKLSDKGMDPGEDGKDKRSDAFSVNVYDRKEFYYNTSIGIPFLAFNPDNGLVLQYNHSLVKYGFRKSPYKSRHNFGIQYATGTSLLNFSYDYRYTNAIGKADFLLESYVHLPDNVSNFFGLSNVKSFSVGDFDDINFFRYERSDALIRPSLSWTSPLGHSSFTIGPYLRYVDVGANDDRFLTQFDQSGLGPEIFEASRYLGLHSSLELNRVDNQAFPTIGMRFMLNTSYNHNLNNENDRFTRLEGALTLYNYLWVPKPFVLATKIQGGINFGDFNFFQGNFIGQANGLRGFRIDRFGGSSSLLFTNDLRLKIATSKGGALPLSFGLIGSYDFGRVWNDGEENTRWHQSYGGGLFISPFDIMPISFYYLKSTENTSNFLIKIGFAI